MLTSNPDTATHAPATHALATHALATRMRRTAKRLAFPLLALYLAAILSPLAVAFVLGKRGKDSFIYQIGLSVALVGLAVLCLQFVLSSRAKWMEQPFGLDRVYGFHRAMGMFAGALLIAHPFLLAAGRRGWPLLFGLWQKPYVWIGRFALLALIVLAAQAIFRSKLRLDYTKWKSHHATLSLALLAAGLIHAWLAGGDSKLPAMKALWVLLGVVGLTAFVWRRFGVAARLRRQPYVVRGIKQEAQGVWTLELAPQSGELPAYLPGQYQYLTLCHDGLPREEHPFTLSSSPTQTGTFSSTIKESGDFTNAIGNTKVGDLALVQAPFGRFSFLLFPGEDDLVFLAGGIGITPLMSMLRFLRDTRSEKNVLLLYSNTSPTDIAFRDELCDLEAGRRPRLKTCFFLSKPDQSWSGETGRIDQAALSRLCPDTHAKSFYLCGPPAFLDAITSLLSEKGVPLARIHFERFDS